MTFELVDEAPNNSNDQNLLGADLVLRKNNAPSLMPLARAKDRRGSAINRQG